MKNKIKILVDAHVFDGIFQGSRTFLKGLYTKLSDSDSLDIYLAANDVTNLQEEFSDIPGNLKFIKLNSASKIQRLLIDFPRVIDKNKFDYAHFQYIDPPIKICKTIITVHDVLFLEFTEDFSWAYRQKKYLFKLAASRSNILTTDSQYSRHAIHRFLNIPLERIEVVKPALESNFLDAPSDITLQLSRKNVQDVFGFDKYIIYVSRIEPRKNHEFLLQAYLDLELWKRGYHLVFVGKNSIKNTKLNSLYGAMNSYVNSFIHHHESVSHDLLIDMFRAASLFVYPTRAEGFGYPLLEAGAMGVETLTSDATCLSEFEFFQSRFFNPDDLESLKSKILAILDVRFTGEKMSGISRTIRDSFGWENSAVVMEKLIFDNFRAGR